MPRKRKTQPITTATGQPYGEATALADAQRAMPLPQVDKMAVAKEALAAMSPPPGGFARETERPDEPVQAGLAMGPGPGPEVIAGMSGSDGDVLVELGAIYQKYPSEGLKRLIESARRRGPTG